MFFFPPRTSRDKRSEVDLKVQWVFSLKFLYYQVATLLGMLKNT